MSENDNGCLAETQIPHVMIDIETLGIQPGSVISAIGAVVFRPWLAPDHADFIVEAQSSRIDISDAQKAGLTIDASTVQWWFRQSPEAIAATFNGETEPLFFALLKLAAFIDQYDSPTIWAHSPSFDLVLLEAAYRAVNLKVPWKYHQARDTRTLFDVAGVVLSGFPVHGVKHDALSDAINQANVVGHALQLLECRE